MVYFLAAFVQLTVKSRSSSSAATLAATGGPLAPAPPKVGRKKYPKMNRIEAADAATRTFCLRVQRGCSSSFWFDFLSFAFLSLAAGFAVGDDGEGALLAPARKLAAV